VLWVWRGGARAPARAAPSSTDASVARRSRGERSYAGAAERDSARVGAAPADTTRGKESRAA
ncbi:MAG: hypothetical protein ACYDHT_09980, partial [Solirubrobacteraceae bacterium]